MSDLSDLAERTERVLGKYGVDLCEYFLLDTARLESPVPPPQFASFAKNLSGGDSRGQFTLEQYEEGLERLFVKGLLVVVTPAEVEAESAQNRRAGIPELRLKNYEHGDNVDFSLKGFDVNANIVRELHGEDVAKKLWGGFNIDPVAQRIDVYGTTADGCRRTMDRFLNPRRPLFGKRNHHYVVEQGPSPVGAWSPKRFVTLSSGFHGVLTYTVG